MLLCCEVCQCNVKKSAGSALQSQSLDVTAISQAFLQAANFFNPYTLFFPVSTQMFGIFSSKYLREVIKKLGKSGQADFGL